ncbi:MAG: HD domain-containing protein [Bacillaceae bacterium]|nr:HD domain-containing protein [Bacillaceae bacterium]
MKNKKIIIQTEKWMEKVFRNESTGHDIWHLQRVMHLAEHIARKEGGDVFICKMTALLHDYPDEKLTKDPEQAYQDIIYFLKKHNIDQQTIEQILCAMKDVSFRGKHRIPETLEGKVVQDADRLDAIGAIGIARTFAFGGKRGQPIHDPAAPGVHDSQSYRSPEKTTIQHFYEKLLLLKDYMNTDTAKKIALKRHQLMENYLSAFYSEWDAKDLE